MRPTDPRLRRQLAPARAPLAVVGATGVAASLLLVAQAFAVTGLLVAAIRRDAVVWWAVFVALVFVGRGVAGWASDVAAAAAADAVGSDLRARVVRAIVRGAGGNSDPGGARGSSGSLSVLATRGVTAAEPYLTRYLPALVLAGVLPVITLVAIALLDPMSALIVLVTLPLIPVFGILVGLATRDRAESQWRAMADLSGHFLDVMRGLPTLVVFRRAKAQSRVIREVTERYRERTVATLRIAFASSAILELIATISVALVAVTVGIRLASGHLSLHTALVVLLLAPEAYWPLRRVGTEFHAAAEGTATLEATSRLVTNDTDSSRTSLDSSRTSLDSSRTSPRRGVLRESRVNTRVGRSCIESGEAESSSRPNLVVQDVSVTYPGRGLPALATTSAEIASVGVTALVGPSGCGKSTLLRLLAGLTAPTNGVVHADGKPAVDEEWRSHVAYLPQQPVFVTGTVADNLRLGAPSATDDELWTVLGNVALAERIRALVDGLDTELGEDGAGLSGGERARLALARVILSDRPWILLDEPTAHLDPVTEQVIADAVAELGREHGVIVVAHTPALVDLADHVIELGERPSSVTSQPRPRRVSDVRDESASLVTSRRSFSRLDAASPDSRTTSRLARQSATGAATTGAATTGAATTGAATHDSTTRDSPTRDSGQVLPSGRGLRLGLATVLGGLASASGVALTATAGWLIVRAAEHPAILTLTVAMVGVRFFGLARPGLRYVERLKSHDAALRMLADERVAVYDAIVPLVPGRLGRRRGDVLAAVVDDVDAVLDRELRVRIPVRGFAMTAALALITSALIDAEAAGVVAAVTAAAGLAFVLAKTGAARAERRLVTARADLSQRVVEAAQAADELLMWQADEVAVARVDEASRAIGRANRVSARWLGAARALILTAAGLGVVATVALAQDDVSGPVLALLALLPLALAEPAASLADAGTLAARTKAAEERLAELAHETPAVTDPAEPQPRPATSDIELAHVDAAWDEVTVLSELDLTLKTGEKIAVVGPSGSGKSTLAALLLRFIDPSRGTAKLGRTSYPDLALDTIHENVGLVDDAPHVFASTVAENVRLARPGSSDDDVAEALRRAHLGDWLDDLPAGLDTRLGDGYAEVSGGERARLAVARSILADHPVLVLDEPTAHLDSATATALADDVLTDDDGRTVVWITHAPAGLDRVDRVLALRQDAYRTDEGAQ